MLQQRAKADDVPEEEKKEYIVEGYALRYEAYPLYEDEDGTVYERFDPEAFTGTDMSDVIFQLNHTGTVMARMSNNTLALEFDDEGLHIEADLSKSAAARNAYEEIENGLITKMSWAFKPEKYHYDEESRTLVHTKVSKIYDVSMVSIPANDTTSINARSLIDGEIEKAAQELREARINEIKNIIGGVVNGKN